MDISQLHDGDYIRAEGTVRLEPRAVHGRELCIRTITILSRTSAPLPLPLAKWKLNTSLETKLNLRPVSLRNIRELSRFRIQEGVVRGFRDFLYSQGFTEIHTPKSAPKALRADQIFLNYLIFTSRPSWSRARSFINR